MKQYAVAPEGCADYLTPGERYLIQRWDSSNAFRAHDSDGNEIYGLLEGCCHLNGGNWTIITEETQMTPCEKLGYKVGDEFEVVEYDGWFNDGDKVKLAVDDGSFNPFFHGLEGCKNGYGVIHKMKKISHYLCDVITLAPGDYIATADLSEGDYHKVARAFMAAGAAKGEYPSAEYFERYEDFGWSQFENACYHQGSDAGVRGYFKGRQLTITQVLNAANAGNAQTGDGRVKEFNLGDKVVLNGYRNDGDDHHCGTVPIIEEWIDDETVLTVKDDTKVPACFIVTDGSRSAAIHPSEMIHDREPVDEEPKMHLTDQLEQAIKSRDEAQSEVERLKAEWISTYPNISGAPKEDLNDPSNWRAGDVVECTYAATHLYTAGREYKCEVNADGNVIVLDNSEDGTGTLAINTLSKFKFIHRP